MTAWQPYTQVITSPGQEIMATTDVGLAANVAFQGNSYFAQPHLDPLARECAYVHVASGCGFRNAIWNGICPVLVPGWFSGYAGRVGFEPGWNGLFFYSYVLKGWQSSLKVAAQTAVYSGSGLPGWQDPLVEPPPASEDVGGHLVRWTYDAFTSIDADVAFAATTKDGIVATPFTIYAREVPNTDNQSAWVVGDGTTRFTGAVATDATVTPSGSQHIADLTVPTLWRMSSSLMEPGGLANDDPFYPAVQGQGGSDCSDWIEYRLAVTVRRHGRRRSGGAAPPLHQRQRTDGLGGGPPHASRNTTSRQLSAFQRGTL